MSLMDLNPGLTARSGRRRDYNFCGFAFAVVCLSELPLTCPHSVAATRPRPGQAQRHGHQATRLHGAERPK